ncbi:unnamed protein product [Rotaria sp. Silwood2]|nr:unnamed protein product [Rotaria sp. Silwood2]
MSYNFVSSIFNHTSNKEPIAIPRSKLNTYLPPLITSTQANILLVSNKIFKNVDKNTYNYMTIAKSLSSPVTFVFDRLNDDEIEAKERELDDRLKQDDEQALRNANQLCEEQDNVSTKQQAKTKSKKKSSTNNKQMKNDVMFTPELLSSSMNFISSPSHITTSRDNQENISTWCISEEIKEYNLDNVEFEHDELIDDPCYNNEKMPEVNQFKEELPEPLSSRTYSASTSNEMHNLFAIFGLQFEHDYKRLWSETFPKLIRPCFRPGSIQIDLFGFAHLRTNPSIPSIISPNIDPIDSYNSYTVLKKKTKEFCANQILIGEVTTSCLDFKDCNQESILNDVSTKKLIYKILQLERILFFLMKFYYKSSGPENFIVILSGRFNKHRSPSRILDSIMMSSNLTLTFPLLFYFLSQDRPTFSQLYDQINKIIKLNYSNNELNIMETNDETYSSLQQD